MRLLARLAVLWLSILAWAVVISPAAWAAGVVGTGSPASCDSSDLQAALNGGGIVTFRCGAAPHTITVDTYVINDDTIIRGDNKIILDAESLRQIFIVANNATLTLQDIILRNGEFASGGCVSVDINGTLITYNTTFNSCRDTSATLGGGAVYNLGTFTAVDSRFAENQANNEGGAVFNRGTFNATFVTFEANSAGDDSGAIENDGDGVVVVHDSEFIGNIAQGGGGAIGNALSFPETEGSFTIRRALFVDNTSQTFGGAINNVIGTMIVQNSTFVRNTSNQGGGIFSDGNAATEITFSTFDDNRADTGGAIYRPLLGNVSLGYSSLAGSRNEANTSDQLECDGPSLTSLGYNIVEDGSCVDGSNPSDMRNTAPLFGPLQDNGGFSWTMMPDPGSPAHEKVPGARCPRHDQRLARRVARCDIGAAEEGGLFDTAFMPRLRK